MTAEQLIKRAKEKKAKEETEGLCNPASREIFQAWYILGGSQSPPSLTDLYKLPAWLLEDIVYIYGIIGEERERMRKKRPKPGKKK